MKRLFGITGLTCLCVLTACFYFNLMVMYITAACAFVLFVVTMFIKNLRKDGTLPLAFITIVLSVILFVGFTNMRVKPVMETYDGKTCQVVATQTKEVYKNYNYYCYELKVKSIDGNKVKSNIRLYTKEHIFSDAYDEITFTSDLIAVENASDIAKGVYLRAYYSDEVNNIQVYSPVKKPLMYHIVNLRENLKSILYLEMPYDNANFSSAVLLGDKHSLSEEMRDVLRLCGLSHISVVSGLHLSIIAFLSRKLFSFIPNNYISCVFTILVVIFFMLLCGCTIPVVRSGVMLIIYLLGTIIPRQSDSLNSIGFAALVIILINPYSVGDIGMLLSFSATIGIVVWYDKLYSFMIRPITNLSIMGIKPLGFIIKTIVGSFVCSLCATIWTLPVTTLAFGVFSSVGIIANILIVPFMPLMIISIILCILTHFLVFVPFIAKVFSFISGFFYDYIMYICSGLSEFPYAFIHTDKSYFYFSMGATCILIAVAVLINTKLARKVVIFSSVMMVLWSGVLYNLTYENIVRIHIPDTGSALSVVLSSSDGHAVLCLGGGRFRDYKVTDAIDNLDSANKNILITTGSDNYMNYAKNISSEFDYEHVLMYDYKGEIDLSLSEVKGKTLSVFSGEEVVNLWGKVQVELIPAKDVVYEYITAGDTEVLVIPEDADSIELKEEYRNPDIIIMHEFADNIGLLSCDTLIIPGDDFTAQATAEVCAPIAKRVITGTDIFYDIKLN